jgi:hypothetical protein
VAKRYTDTEKWNDDWYISLSNDSRIIWQWLLDNCDHAGVLKPGVKLLNFSCNTSISHDELLAIFSGRLLFVNNVYFIPKFIKFQYPDGLKSKKPVILSVLKILTKNDLVVTLKKSLGNDYIIVDELLDNDSLIIKDKDKDKSKDKDKDEFNGEIFNCEEFIVGRKRDFEAICISAMKTEQVVRDSLTKYHLWMEREGKYPIKKKGAVSGFKLWLMNEKPEVAKQGRKLTDYEQSILDSRAKQQANR